MLFPHTLSVTFTHTLQLTTFTTVVVELARYRAATALNLKIEVKLQVLPLLVNCKAVYTLCKAVRYTLHGEYTRLELYTY